VFSDLHFVEKFPIGFIESFVCSVIRTHFQAVHSALFSKTQKTGMELFHFPIWAPMSLLLSLLMSLLMNMDSLSLFVYFEHLIRVSNLMVLSHFEFVVGTLPI